MKNKLKSLYVLSAMTLVSYTGTAFAVEDVSKRIDNLNASVTSTGNLMYTVIGLVGVIFLVLGVTGFVKYSKDTDRNSWVTPLVYTIMGAILSSFSAWKKIMSGTVTGAEQDSDLGTFKTGQDSNTGG